MIRIETARSSLARGISNANLAESLMAFNTNYRDTGIFGIYTIAPVSLLLNLLSLFLYNLPERKIGAYKISCLFLLSHYELFFCKL